MISPLARPPLEGGRGTSGLGTMTKKKFLGVPTTSRTNDSERLPTDTGGVLDANRSRKRGGGARASGGGTRTVYTKSLVLICLLSVHGFMPSASYCTRIRLRVFLSVERSPVRSYLFSSRDMFKAHFSPGEQRSPRDLFQSA